MSRSNGKKTQPVRAICSGITAVIVLGSTAAAAETSQASAQTDSTQTSSDAPERKLHHVAVTASLVRLLFPVAEMSVEARLGRRISLTALAGYGHLKVSATDDAGHEQKLWIKTWEAGGQFNGYLLGDFDHGMQLGFEAKYLSLSLPSGISVSGTADGLLLGPYMGYKYTAGFGLTVGAQLGIQIATLRAHGDDGDTNYSRSGRVPLPLLNANAGWAF